jgi:hypothetical protein
VHTGSELKRAAALTAALGVALVWVTLAVSAPGDPQIKLRAADQAYAKTFVLRKGELPAGSWKAKPTDFSQPNPACLVKNYSYSALTVTGETGLTFTSAAGLPIVESDALVFPSAAQAQTAFSIDSKAGFARCLGADLATELGKTPGVKASVQKIEPLAFAGLAASTRGFRILLQLKSSQSTGFLDVTFVAIRRGRAIGELSLVRTGASASQAVVRTLAGKMATRMTKG